MESVIIKNNKIRVIELLSMDLFNSVNVLSTIKYISIETILNHVIDGRWDLENLDDDFNLSKLEIETLVMGLMRKFPMITIDIADYSLNGKRNVDILSHSFDIMALILYVNNYYPEEIKSLRELLNELKTGGLKSSDNVYSIVTGERINDLTFNALDDKTKKFFYSIQIPVQVISLSIADENKLPEIKEFIKTKRIK